MTLLNSLLNLSNKTLDIDIANTIKNYVIDSITLDNITAYYSEGRFDKYSNNNDVFFKLILVPKNMDINDTWLIDNLHNREMNGAYNIIIHRNYDSIALYAINENIVLYADEQLSINREQLGNVLSQSIIYSEHLRDSVLIYKKIDKDSFQIEVDTYVLEPIMDDYNLAIEFEYRTHFKNKPIKANTSKKNYNIYSFTDDYGYYIRGTVVLGGMEIFNNIKRLVYNEKLVYDLIDKEYRTIDKSNYNDDTELAVMILKIDALNIMTKYGYRIVGTILFKDNVEVTDLIDINYKYKHIVILESAVNKLDIQLIKELMKYVITNIKNNLDVNKLFTPYFYSMQILGDISVDKPYYVELAYKLMELGYQETLYNCNINIVYGNDTMEQDITKLSEVLNLNMNNIYNKIKSLNEYNKLMEMICNEITK